MVFVTSQGQVLHFPASQVRPQGRPAGGMAGMRIGRGDSVVGFSVVLPDVDAQLVTVAGHSSALPGTDPGTVKVAPLDIFPAKGRGTGGVRCHRLLKSEDGLILAFAGPGPVRAAAADGVPLDLPDPDVRRDASGTPSPQPIAALSSPL